ncbi:MAG: exodeoxyribonuclease VII large subunit [Chitinophagaceae bacterium]
MITTSHHIQTLRLSDLGRRIAETISNSFSHLNFWVIAEISNHSHYALKDHHYFELIEKEDEGILAKMQAVAWRPGALKIKNFELVTGQKFRNGIKVCVRVQVDFHPSFGLKLLVSDIDPSFTLGQLELQRQSTLLRLIKECSSFIQQLPEGLLTRNNSLQHSPVIQRIAILSSNASAGYEDFIHTLTENQFQYKFILHNYFIAVQGEAHADKICERLDEIGSAGLDFDVVVIIRGGGADTDFILFDQFSLCRTVAGFSIPVITGIGHLKNQSILDLVAHTSTNAPTRAAEFIIAHNRNFEMALLEEQKKVVFKTQQILQRQEQSVERNNVLLVRNSTALINHHREKQEALRAAINRDVQKQVYNHQNMLKETASKILHRPQLLLAYRKIQLENIHIQIKQLPGKYLSAKQRQIDYYEVVCRMMSPVNLLKKGFALLYRDDKILTEGSSVGANEKLMVMLQDAELNITVNSKILKDGEEINL